MQIDAHSLISASGGLAIALWAGCFFLMLRLPALERALGGLDKLYWVHHVTGGVAYVVVLAHVVSAAWPAMADGRWVDAATVLNPVGGGTFQSFGWLALLLLMVMMLATFWLALPYRRWRFIHLVVIPAFGLGLLHAWPLASEPGRLALAAAGLMALASVLYQAALRHSRVRTHAYRVARAGHLRPDLLDLELQAQGDPVQWSPGQFVFAAFFQGGGWQGCGEHHPYTVAGGSPDANAMRLLVRSQGPCTEHVQSVPVGTLVRVEGPYGSFLSQRSRQQAQLWIAGGIGITPFLAALEQLEARPDDAPIDLFHIHRPGDASVVDCLPPETSLRQPGARLHPMPSDHESVDEVWSRIRDLTGDLANRQVFLCGPTGLVEALEQRLKSAGIRPRDIHSERFDFR